MISARRDGAQGTRILLSALTASCLLQPPHAQADSTNDAASVAAGPVDAGLVVTPDVLLEHVQKRLPEVAALPELAWSDSGQRVLLSVVSAEATSSGDEAVPGHAIESIDVHTGQPTRVGTGYRPVTASLGDIVAYFADGSNDRRVIVARINGERLCTIDDRDLMADSTGIQAIALTADGQRLALAVGFGAARSRGAQGATGLEGAAVRVFDGERQGAAPHGVALWATDVQCRGRHRVADASQFRIGRLAWTDGNRKIVAVAATPVPGKGFPRSDLLLFNLSANTWRILAANIGEQAGVGRVGFLQPAPGGRHVAFMYDQDALPYALRKQLAIASLDDGRVRVVSGDPRQGAGWLDARTLWMTIAAPHRLLARSATLGLDGSERETLKAPGAAVPSPDGRRLAWLATDLYGNSTLSIADVGKRGSAWTVGDGRVIWRSRSVLMRYARGERRWLECESTDGVRPAAILVLPIDHDPQRRYPLIVDIHGGPQGGLESGDFAYAPAGILNSSTLEHDMWAAKGYAVLVPDYRASGLYGFDEVPRDGSGFARDFDDILCNVDEVVRAGIADPARMAVIGHSYGGAQVNWIVTHSRRFRVAISKEGSFNVDARVAWADGGHTNQLSTLLYGSPLEHPERYRSMSVIEAVRGVTTPTMFVEHRGGRRAGDLYAWLFAAWRDQGVEAQLRLYEEERHTLRRPADQKDMLYAAIDWIDGYIGNAGAPPLTLPDRTRTPLANRVRTCSRSPPALVHGRPRTSRRSHRPWGSHQGSLGFAELSFRQRLSSLQRFFDSAPGHIQTLPHMAHHRRGE